MARGILPRQCPPRATDALRPGARRVIARSGCAITICRLREDIEPSIDLEQSGPVLAAVLKPQAAGLFADDQGG